MLFCLSAKSFNLGCVHRSFLKPYSIKKHKSTLLLQILFFSYLTFKTILYMHIETRMIIVHRSEDVIYKLDILNIGLK